MAGRPLPQLTGGTREEGSDKVRRWRLNKEGGDESRELPQELWTNSNPHRKGPNKCY